MKNGFKIEEILALAREEECLVKAHMPGGLCVQGVVEFFDGETIILKKEGRIGIVDIDDILVLEVLDKGVLG